MLSTRWRTISIYLATPLMMASYFGETEIVKLLIANGADVNFINGEGQTALRFAQQKNQSSIIRVLRQAGATSIGDGCEWKPFH